MKRHRYLPPVIIICLTLAIVFARNLRTGTECYSESAIMMDTIVEVNIWGRGSVSAEVAASSAFAEIARVESIFGDGIVDSRIAQDVLASREFEYLMDVSAGAHRLTGGQFDPTIGSVSRLWHFWDGAEIPDQDTLRKALEAVGLDLYLAGDGNSRFIFDVGGIAKGYAVDRAADRLRSLGFKSAIINAGGDLKLLGRRPDGKMWRIAIRHPRRTGDFVGYLDLEDAAVATSGDYEKYFVLGGERYHHILNPATGLPGRLCESVTVVAESACLGDALATGLFLVGASRGLEAVEGRQGIEAVFVSAEGESILVSSGLSESFGRFKSE
jgi:thiamine biosynthesis lipoprotein